MAQVSQPGAHTRFCWVDQGDEADFSRMSDAEMGLYVVDTLCFQLGGARRRMTWRQFILTLGLHTSKEMA
ncbi:hypothetical protein Tco_0829405 [Tanacetum coccineum]